MSRLNTLYPNDEFLKGISNVMGKVDSKNETEIKQEIEQIGYKEFYRYSKEKDVYIKQLKQENKQLKEKYIAIEKERKTFLEHLDNVEQQRDLYKEVIEEIRKTLKLERKTALSLNQAYTVSVIDSVLQILEQRQEISDLEDIICEIQELEQESDSDELN